MTCPKCELTIHGHPSICPRCRSKLPNENQGNQYVSNEGVQSTGSNSERRSWPKKSWFFILVGFVIGFIFGLIVFKGYSSTIQQSSDVLPQVLEQTPPETAVETQQQVPSQTLSAEPIVTQDELIDKPHEGVSLEKSATEQSDDLSQEDNSKDADEEEEDE